MSFLLRRRLLFPQNSTDLRTQRRRAHFVSVQPRIGLAIAPRSGQQKQHNQQQQAEDRFPDNHYPQLLPSLASITLGFLSAHVARTAWKAISNGDQSANTQSPKRKQKASFGSESVPVPSSIVQSGMPEDRAVQAVGANVALPRISSMAPSPLPPPTVPSPRPLLKHSPSASRTKHRLVPAQRRTKHFRTFVHHIAQIMQDFSLITNNHAQLSTYLLYLNQTLFHPQVSTSLKPPKHMPNSLMALQSLLEYMVTTKKRSHHDKEYIRLLKDAARHGSLLAKYNLAVCFVQVGELETALALFAEVVGGSYEESESEGGEEGQSQLYLNALFNLRVLVGEGVGQSK
ncbi:hypothetical protein BCR33DRAFT_721471 [Rhizoclosmatium globosum]|uniref:Uncharacterized protein n=1 Tax=Rhizoclosmatium globosum TaxID=329046 RepID=A0A1Y2BRQ5_9FUNG|nr:hypothetical protein BCR33DRAFT_721471 [Rhizoclosmatium globosum]|eukprot:ORY37426.1 hypothetical protein BCR33DRAFT_721471 [Rhizoclosmatium globosum]